VSILSGLRRGYLSARVGPIHGHSWKRYIQKALTENDPNRLLHFVYATEIALFFCWQELDGKSDEPERAAMPSAADIYGQSRFTGWAGRDSEMNTFQSIDVRLPKGYRATGQPLFYRKCAACRYDFIGEKKQAFCASCRFDKKYSRKVLSA
jgi:hypothetical protein